MLTRPAVELSATDGRRHSCCGLIDAWEAAQPRGGDRSRQLRAAAYTQVFIVRTVGDRTIDLRVDLVNDVMPRFGESALDPIPGHVDNLWKAGVDPRSVFNILSSVPASELAQVRWTRDIDLERLRGDRGWAIAGPPAAQEPP